MKIDIKQLEETLQQNAFNAANEGQTTPWEKITLKFPGNVAITFEPDGEHYDGVYCVYYIGHLSACKTVYPAGNYGVTGYCEWLEELIEELAGNARQRWADKGADTVRDEIKKTLGL